MKYKFFLFEDDDFPIGKDYTYAVGEDTYSFEYNERLLANPAEQAAEYYFNNCDGWEDRWPLNFCVLTEDGKEIGLFTVHQEMAFSAEEIIQE